MELTCNSFSRRCDNDGIKREMSLGASVITAITCTLTCALSQITRL